MNWIFLKAAQKPGKKRKRNIPKRKRNGKKALKNSRRRRPVRNVWTRRSSGEFAGLEREYQQESELLAEECRMLESQRFALHQEIEKKLEDLQTARAKLTAAASGMYGAHFQEALGVCERSIQNYRELLDLLEEGRKRLPGGTRRLPGEACKGRRLC